MQAAVIISVVLLGGSIVAGICGLTDIDLKRTAFLLLAVAILVGFIFIAISPLGFWKAYVHLYGKITGTICQKPFCFEKATGTKKYVYHPVGAETNESDPIKTFKLCKRHQANAPNSVFCGNIGAAIISFVICGLGFFILFYGIRVCMSGDKLHQWYGLSLLILGLLAFNWLPWLAATLNGIW